MVTGTLLPFDMSDVVVVVQFSPHDTKTHARPQHDRHNAVHSIYVVVGVLSMTFQCTFNPFVRLLSSSQDHHVTWVTTLSVNTTPPPKHSQTVPICGVPHGRRDTYYPEYLLVVLH